MNAFPNDCRTYMLLYCQNSARRCHSSSRNQATTQSISIYNRRCSDSPPSIGRCEGSICSVGASKLVKCLLALGRLIVLQHFELVEKMIPNAGSPWNMDMIESMTNNGGFPGPTQLCVFLQLGSARLVFIRDEPKFVCMRELVYDRDSKQQ
jgi:hypothetical protein